MKTTESPHEALARIQAGGSKNDMLAALSFKALGVPLEDIEPRVNILTFRAWRALDRRVAKGAMSVRVTVWIPKRGEDTEAEPDKAKRSSCYPKTTCLFHVSQTVPSDAPKGARPDAWNNPELVREGTYEPDAVLV